MKYTQCAAVTTQCSATIEPPQNGGPPRYLVNATCQGQLPSFASFPPTIRGS